MMGSLRRFIERWTVLATSLMILQTVQAQSSPQPPLETQCASEFQPLVQQMLPVLPSYANRVYTRVGLAQRYMIVASPPNFEPLPLQVQDTPSSTVRQVFFTTLTRRYREQQIQDLQEYHWLFLTPSDSGWRFSMLYSITGDYPKTRPPDSPRNTSEGAVAQAIRNWLRTCRTER